MDATDGYPSYPVTVRMNGTVLSGHTTVPIPEDRCCFASHLGFSSEESVESTAIHEAGHAVAGFLVGVPAVPVEVVVDPPCPECGAFRAHGRNASVPLNIASASDTLMVLAAGVQAELLWNTSKGELTPERRWAIEVGGFGDQELAQQVAEATATVPGSGWSALDYGPPGPVAAVELGVPTAAGTGRADRCLAPRLGDSRAPDTREPADGGGRNRPVDLAMTPPRLGRREARRTTKPGTWIRGRASWNACG